jgi:hypothetical protein
MNMAVNLRFSLFINHIKMSIGNAWKSELWMVHIIILTNIKAKIIRSGIQGVNIEAWKKVAVSQKTNLSPAILTIQNNGKIMHHQSDPFVRTMFAYDVERCLRENGDISEAEFCKIFREWHEAEDMAGISAMERCERAMSLRRWILEGFNF